MIFQKFGPKPNWVSISGHSERISPGQIQFQFGRPVALNSPPGRPTSERIWPGEILIEGPEIARALGKMAQIFRKSLRPKSLKIFTGPNVT